MRMKRFIAWILIIVLTCTALPTSALADTTYQTEFYLVAGNNAAEQEFRQWASKLIRWYREDYLCLDENNEYQQHTVSVGKKEVVNLDDAPNHLYYQAGKAFMDYQGNASWWHNSEWKDPMDGTRSIEVYMAILADTLWEKADLDPAFLNNTNVHGGKTVRFHVQVGKMENDQVMFNIQTNAELDAAQSGAEVVLSAVKTALDYAILKNSALKSLKEDAMQAAEDKLAGRKTYSWRQFWNDNLTNMQTKAVEALKEFGSDTVETYIDNAKTACNNAIKQVLIANLSNAYLQASDVVIDTLNTVYGSNDAAWRNSVYAPYAEAARKMLEILQDEDTPERMKREAMSQLEGMQIEETLTNEELFYCVFSSFLTKLTEYFVDCIGYALQRTAKALLSAAGLNKEGWEADLAEAINEFVSAECNDISGRINKAIDAALEKVSFTDTNSMGDSWKQFWMAFLGGSEYEEGKGTLAQEISGWENELLSNFITLFVSAISTGVGVVRNRFFSSKNGSKDTPDLAQREQEAKELADSYLGKYIEYEGKEVGIKDVFTAVLSGVLSGVTTYTYNAIEPEFDKKNEENAAFLKALAEASQCFDSLFDSICTWIRDTKKPLEVKGDKFVAAIINVTTCYARLSAEDQSKASDAFRKAFKQLGGESGKFREKLWGAIKSNANSIYNSIFDFALKDNGEIIFLNEAATVNVGAEHRKDSMLVEQTNFWLSILDQESLNEYASAAALKSMFSDFWTLGTDIGKFGQSAMTAANAEAAADYVGQLLSNTWRASYAHESTLRPLTYYDANGYMTPERVLDPEKCPDLEAIKNVTDMILLQLNEDLVGLGSYLTLTINANDAWKNAGYVKWIKSKYPGTLVTKQEAKVMYQTMLDQYNYWSKESYPFAEWNSLLFLQGE